MGRSVHSVRSVRFALALLLLVGAAGAGDKPGPRPPDVRGHYLGQSEAEAKKASEAINFFYFACGNKGEGARICISRPIGARQDGPMNLTLAFVDDQLSMAIYVFDRLDYREVLAALREKYGQPTSETKSARSGRTFFWERGKYTITAAERGVLGNHPRVAIVDADLAAEQRKREKAVPPI